jgi:hypothetical protein
MTMVAILELGFIASHQGIQIDRLLFEENHEQ